LGTPHRGSAFASWGTVVANLAKLTLQNPNTRIIETLDVNGEVLDNLADEFLHIVIDNDMKLHSFQEARGITGVKGLSGKVRWKMAKLSPLKHWLTLCCTR
jgi:hypothetical protein